MMSSTPPRILLEQSRRAGAEVLRGLLDDHGCEVELTHLHDVVAMVRRRQFDLVLFDLPWDPLAPPLFELFQTIRTIDASLRILAVVDSCAVGLGVEATRRGAHNFLLRPPENQQFLRTITSEADLARVQRRTQLLEAENLRLRGSSVAQRLIAVSPVMSSFVSSLGRVARSDGNILIAGEQGVEKETVAAAIHAASRRSGKPFVRVELGALDESEFAARMYGRHEQDPCDSRESSGVGKLELAAGGTLFFDEIANIPTAAQGAFLRVLETGELPHGSARARRVNVRVIAASSAQLEDEVSSGHLWNDLFSALSVLRVVIPPLRERREEIPLMAEELQRYFAARHRAPSRSFDDDAAAWLLRYGWPGNAVELQIVVERAVLVSTSRQLTLGDLVPEEQRESLPSHERSLEEIERILIEKSLRRFDGRVAKAAEALGLPRSTMYRRLRHFHL